MELYNTLTRKKEKFKAIKKDKVGFYSCGPTVYSYQHIGNLRTYIFSDILKRVLKYNKFGVNHVMNVTDVGHLTSDADDGDDKMEIAVKKEGRSAEEIAEFYLNEFKEDLGKLNIIFPDKWTKATEHIKEQIDLIKELEKKGFTYETSDGIYFDSSKFENYGKFALLNAEGLQEGKRVGIGEKKNKTDFALWKFSLRPGEREQEWDSPWGIGFPGWHIECSAMSMKYLGKHFDIHTGGEDHIPVHHTNEIAQSEAFSGKKFVNYWLHAAFLVHKGEKVSKSKGGLYTVSELEDKGYRPLDYRYLCLLTYYRKPLNFTLEHLDAAKKAHERLKRKVIGLRNEKHKGNNLSSKYQKKFFEAVNDDLNIPLAIQVMWEMVDDFNFDPQKKLDLLYDFDRVFGLGLQKVEEREVDIPSNVQKLIDMREEERKRKNWAEADALRERIKEEGFELEDKPEGLVVRVAR